MPHGPSRRAVRASQCTPARCLPVRPTELRACPVLMPARCAPWRRARRWAPARTPDAVPAAVTSADRGRPGSRPVIPAVQDVLLAYGDGRGPGGLGAGPHGGPLGTCNRPAVTSSGSRAPACQGRYPGRADRIAASANPAACGRLTGWGGGGGVSSAGRRGPAVPGGVLTATPISVSSSRRQHDHEPEQDLAGHGGMAHWCLLACWASLLGIAPRSRRQGTPGLGLYGLDGRYPGVAWSNWAVTDPAIGDGAQQPWRGARPAVPTTRSV